MVAFRRHAAPIFRLSMGLGPSYGYRPGTWAPTELGAALAAWWNADDHGTARMVDDGAELISSWTDRKSGIAATGTTTARPTWGASAFATGKAGVTFDGTATNLTSTSLGALPTGGTAGEMWIATTATVDQATTTVAFSYGAGAGVTRRIQRSPSEAVGVSDATTTLTHPTTSSLLGSHVARGTWSGTSMEGWLNGTAFPNSPATIGALATATTRLRIGAASTTSAATFYQGVIRHAIVITGLLSSENRQRLGGWLAWDCGLQSLLPSDHPYKNVRP